MKQIKKILIDNSGYELKNFGDIAMLMIAVYRLHQAFPHADIRIFTDTPERLRKFIPNAIPVSLAGRRQWQMAWSLLGGIHKLLPSAMHSWLQHQEILAKLNYPVISRHWMESRLYKRGYDLTAMRAFLDEVFQADIVIASGGGYITDSFENHAIRLLQTLALAQSLGKPTALFGQGLGPAISPSLLHWAKRVLPHLDSLFLRERLYSKPFAISVGVAEEKLNVTGDDAIMLAYSKTPSLFGNAIGVNLRVADYSGLPHETIDVIQEILSRTAKNLGTELNPVPISMHGGDSDLRSLRLLLGDEAADKATQMDSPEKVIEQVGKCRVVVTGSYHAGVFALSQGVSIVAVAATDYYRHKFEGLADQFDRGCRIVDRYKPEFEANLSSAIHKSWDEAATIRPYLLAKAQEQIKSSETAYDTLAASLL
jgi:polysaccharide pyruvyl transferase WcaK-like protein